MPADKIIRGLQDALNGRCLETFINHGRFITFRRVPTVVENGSLRLVVNNVNSTKGYKPMKPVEGD